MVRGRQTTLYAALNRSGPVMGPIAPDEPDVMEWGPEPLDEEIEMLPSSPEADDVPARQPRKKPTAPATAATDEAGDVLAQPPTKKQHQRKKRTAPAEAATEQAADAPARQPRKKRTAPATAATEELGPDEHRDGTAPLSDDDAPLASASLALMVKPEPAGEILMRNPAMTLDTSLFCTKCGYTVDPTKVGVRVVRKSPPTFSCSSCNSKTTMLSTIFGRYPTEAFLDLDEATVQKFWQSAASDKATLKKTFENVVMARMVESRIAEESGPYLPLQTWADAPYHFDIVQIRKKAPMRVHPILGDTYQVKIVTTGDKLQKDMVREQMARMVADRGSAASSKPARGADSATDEEEHSKVKGGKGKDADTSSEASDSESISDTSDGESSDDAKKHKGSKKSKDKKSSKKQFSKSKKSAAKASHNAKKAAQKENDRQRKAARSALLADKQEKARVAKIQADCIKAIGKTSPLTMQLDHLLKDKQCPKVPVIVLKKCQDAYSALLAIEAEAKEKVKSKSPCDLSFSMEDVNVASKDAISSKTVLNNVLNSVRTL